MLGSCDSSEESVNQKRLKSATDSEVEKSSRSRSRSPPGSLILLDPDQQNDTPSQELMGVTSDKLSSNLSQLPLIGHFTTPIEVINQPTVKPKEVSSLTGTQKPDTPMQEDEIVIEDLNVELLEEIGKRVAEDRVLAPAIPKSIAVRLEDILKKGLPKKEREKLLQTHVPPKNCILIHPPKLNKELKVSINKICKKRDQRIVEKQQKITACLALMGSSIVDILNNFNSEGKELNLSSIQITLIKKLSEAARLMADLQRDETLTRRSLILATISSSQKETLDSVNADKWLFGQKLGERLKAAKSIERSGKDLKAKSKVSGKSKNSKIPPRRQPFRPRMSGGYRNKSYNQTQFNIKNWKNQNKEDRSNHTQPLPQQKKT